ATRRARTPMAAVPAAMAAARAARVQAEAYLFGVRESKAAIRNLVVRVRIGTAVNAHACPIFRNENSTRRSRKRRDPEVEGKNSKVAKNSAYLRRLACGGLHLRSCPMRIASHKAGYFRRFYGPLHMGPWNHRNAGFSDRDATGAGRPHIEISDSANGKAADGGRGSQIDASRPGGSRV